MALSDAARTRLTYVMTDAGLGKEVADILNATSVLSTIETAFIDGVTAGTVTASKAVVVDSNKDVAGFRNLTLDGVQSLTNDSATGAVALRVGATATEGLELVVVEKTISPNAIETAVFTVPAGAVIHSVQANCEAALTGGGTTVTWALGTAADPDKYGYPGSDTLAQNSKIDTIPDWAPLASAEPIVLTGVATGGTADGDTALTVGSVRVRIAYWQLNSLDNA